MRTKIALTTLLGVLALTVFLFSNGEPARAQDSCASTCSADCAGITGGARKDCQLACLTGRCEMEVGGASNGPGIDCSEDGTCNEFCEVDFKAGIFDRDCCAPPLGFCLGACPENFGCRILDGVDTCLLICPREG